MSAAKHTPGPWLLWEEEAMRNRGLTGEDLETNLLDVERGFSVFAGTPTEPVTMGCITGCTKLSEVDPLDFEDTGEALANARLIAAAPELLDALRGILAITDRNHVAWDKARLAISKAKGGSR